MPDTDARWRASVPTARRGRKHARARVLPGQLLTAGCLTGVFLGCACVFHCDKSVISGVFDVFANRVGGGQSRAATLFACGAGTLRRGFAHGLAGDFMPLQSVKSDIAGVFDNFSLGMTNDEC